ncbi:hypothetical protein T439DRAFT_355121 [Meredithblackwellia eburnea MCA 4105]
MATSRMDSDEWNLHLKGAEPLKPQNPKLLNLKQYTTTLKVVSAGPDAQSAFQKQVRSRSITIKLHWYESVLYHLELIENALRIPLHLFSMVSPPGPDLACYMLDPRLTMCNCQSLTRLFKAKKEISINVISTMDATKYMIQRPLGRPDWRRQAPKEPQGDSFKEKSVALFNLQDPFPEDHADSVWREYYTERSNQLPNQDSNFSPESVYEEPMDNIRVHIRNFPYQFLVHGGVDKRQAAVLSDGVHRIVAINRSQKDRADLSILTRIYLPHTLDSIEVGFHYLPSKSGDPVFHQNSMGVRIVRADEQGTTEHEWMQHYWDKAEERFTTEQNGWKSVAWSSRKYHNAASDGTTPPPEMKDSFDLTLELLDELCVLLSLKLNLPAPFKSETVTIMWNIYTTRLLVLNFLRSACCCDWDERWPLLKPGGRVFSVGWSTLTPKFWNTNVEKLLKKKEIEELAAGIATAEDSLVQLMRELNTAVAARPSPA